MSEPTPAPPLVLVHGLFDTPSLFWSLRQRLGNRRDPVLAPHLPHGIGSTPLTTLARQLGEQIEATFGAEQPIDLLGFSMGGLIARTWLQLEGGAARTRRFLSIASPHAGSLVALPWPRTLLAGLADMKPGSALLRRLDHDLEPLRRIECLSLYVPTDLMVVPGWSAVLPVGARRPLPIWQHSRVMAEPASLEPIVAELLRP
ncbi:MAG: esterase/lipase family protein [Synechococcaceae cyanobacterium]